MIPLTQYIARGSKHCFKTHFYLFKITSELSGIGRKEIFLKTFQDFNKFSTFCN